MENSTRKSFSMGRVTFLWTTSVLLSLKFVIFALTRSVFLIGSNEYLVLSIGTDVLNVVVGILAVLRMRDAGRSGALGFLGCIASAYGSFLFLTFSFVHNHIALTEMSLGVINILSQSALVVFVISIGRVPSANSSVESAVKLSVRGAAAGRGAAVPSLAEGERVELPVTWDVNRNRRGQLKIVVLSLISILLGIFVTSIGHYAVGLANVLLFGFLLFIFARKSRSLRRIGPGRITITAEGFKDDRLNGMLVPWSSVTTHIVRKEAKSEDISGVIVISNYAEIQKYITDDYKYAYFLSASGKKICLFIDLGRVEDGRRISKTIQNLIEQAR